MRCSRCHDRIGEAKFGIVYEMLKSAPPESRPGTYSPGDDPSLADAVKQLVGNDWISLVDAIEQVSLLDQVPARFVTDFGCIADSLDRDDTIDVLRALIGSSVSATRT